MKRRKELPLGYTVRTQNGDKSFTTLTLYRDGLAIRVSRYVNVWGYRKEWRKLRDLAWFHYERSIDPQ